MKYKIDVIIVDDHAMLVEALANAINQSDTAHVSHCCNSLDACRRQLAEWHPDVLLLDISLPDGNSIDFCEEVMTSYPSTKVISLTSHDEFTIIQRMMEKGVHGYVLKSAPVQELLEAISAVYHGERYICEEVKAIIEKGKAQQIFLTPVERQVLKLICEGLTNPQIASQMNLSTDTINWYRKRLLAKFNAKNSVSLAIIATKEQLI